MNISIYGASAAVVIALITGVGLGYGLTPEYRASMYANEDMSLGRADRTFDLRYINAMIAHHRGAMLLGEQLKENSGRPEMRSLASDILAGEPPLIEELYAWKKDWYGDIRPVQDPIVAELGGKGDTFDLRFLNAIIAHHEAGIEMANEAQVKSSRSEVLDNSYAVEAFLAGGVEKLSTLRSEWYKQ